MQTKRNLAHRMGRWSGLHPWTAIVGWIAFVAVAFMIGNALPKHTLGEADTGVGESGPETNALGRSFTDAQEPATESLFIQSRSGKLTDADVAPVVKDATARLEATGVVRDIGDVERATDCRTARLGFDGAGDPATASD